jgi:hypothetical protein
MRTVHILITIALVSLIAPKVAHAQLGAVVVYGTAKPHEREIVGAAVTRTVRQASWTVENSPFTPKESSDIVTCLALDRPWPCVAPIASAKRIERVAVVQVDPDGKSIVVIGQLLLETTAVPSIERRFCDPCNDQTLDMLTQELTSVLLERTIVRAGKTAIEIRTVPQGASVTIDGSSTGISDTTLAVSAGSHEVQIQRSGYRPHSQHVMVEEGQTFKLLVTLTAAESPGVTPDNKPSRLVPILVGSAGAATLIAGTAYSLTREPSHAPVLQPRFVYSGPGIVVATAGGVALGVGLYLWFRPQARSAPVTVYLPNGGIVGWSGSF